MLTITPSAAQKFREIRLRKQKPEAAMRIAVLGGGCSGLNYFVGLDEFRAVDDIVIQVEDWKIFLDLTSAPYIWGSQIDWIEREGESGFVITKIPVSKPACSNKKVGCSSGKCGSCSLHKKLQS